MAKRKTEAQKAADRQPVTAADREFILKVRQADADIVQQEQVVKTLRSKLAGEVKELKVREAKLRNVTRQARELPLFEQDT